MFDPNVPSFFLIILCGFGVVWGFRKTLKTKGHLSEFEYLAFSTLWGSIIFLPVAYLLERTGALPGLTVYPFLATPWLFLIGLFFGMISAIIGRVIQQKFGKADRTQGPNVM